MKNLILFVLTLCLSFNAFGGSVVLNTGDKAPFTGILIDESTAKSNQSTLLEYDALKASIGFYKDNAEIYSKEAATWRDTATEASKELIKKNNSTFLECMGGFALGSLVTVLLTFAVHQASK